ncbi:MAG: hypothetical protein NVS2B5_13970 [Beijerinckiaceae bacterium]
MRAAGELAEDFGQTARILDRALQSAREGRGKRCHGGTGLFRADAEALGQIFGCLAALGGLKDILQVRHNLSLPMR